LERVRGPSDKNLRLADHLPRAEFEFVANQRSLRPAYLEGGFQFDAIEGANSFLINGGLILEPASDGN
jgi:hypothetical protein